MIIGATPTRARTATRIRFGLLVVVGLLIGHDAVYAVRNGVGDRFATAMTALGHDGWWSGFTLAAALAALGLALGSLVVIWRLQRRLAGSPARPGSKRGTGPTNRAEFTHLWPRLLVAVSLAFAVQENIETFRATGAVPGIDVLIGTGFPFAILILGLVSLVLAAVGALVRWRVATLRRLLAAAQAPRRRVHVPTAPARGWVDSTAALRWIPDPRDAGRAPPADAFA